MTVWEITGYIQAEIDWKVIHPGIHRVDSSVSWEVEPNGSFVPLALRLCGPQLLVMVFSVQSIHWPGWGVLRFEA